MTGLKFTFISEFSETNAVATNSKKPQPCLWQN